MYSDDAYQFSSRTYRHDVYDDFWYQCRAESRGCYEVLTYAAALDTLLYSADLTLFDPSLADRLAPIID